MGANFDPNGPVQIDYIVNGQAMSGGSGVAERLLNNNLDTGALRGFINAPDETNPEGDGRSYISVINQHTGKRESILTNSQAALRFQDWRLIDEAILEVSKPELAFISDLRSRGLEVSLPNGLAHTIFSYEDISDTGPAQISMDGIRRGNSDRPVVNIYNLPLPIIHKDFSFPVRQILESRNGRTPLDLQTLKQSVRRVAETAELLALGVNPTYSYGGGTIYGLTNFTKRLTKTITAPTAVGWTPNTMVQEVLAMRTQSQLAYHMGPWMLYTSTNLDQYLDEDYSSAKGDKTLRERLAAIKGIIGVKTLDHLQFLAGSPYTIAMVMMKDTVIREVVCLDTQVVQWNSPDGMESHFKVMASMVPQWRADQNGNTGVVHGSAAYP